MTFSILLPIPKTCPPERDQAPHRIRSHPTSFTEQVRIRRLRFGLSARIWDKFLLSGAMRDAFGTGTKPERKYPDETEDQLISRFHKELEDDQALRRALMRDVFKHLLQELGEGKPANSKE